MERLRAELAEFVALAMFLLAGAAFILALSAATLKTKTLLGILLVLAAARCPPGRGLRRHG